MLSLYMCTARVLELASETDLQTAPPRTFVVAEGQSGSESLQGS